MGKESKGLWKTLLVAFGAMMVVPLAFRVWERFNPPVVEEGFSLSEYLAKASADRPFKLLTTPLAAWTETDRKDEPRLAAWLEAQAKTVLPWEWTDEARRKDPKGYAQTWRGILDAETDGAEPRLKDVKKDVGRLSRELEIVRTLWAHDTNRLANVRIVLASDPTNATLAVETLAKGRFWGWNRTTEQVAVGTETERGALLKKLTQGVSELMKKEASLENDRRRQSAEEAKIEKKLSVLRDCREKLSAWERQEPKARDERHDEFVQDLVRGLAFVIR